MHVIILLLILLFVCFLIAHWQISLPVLLFLVYVGSIFARDTPIRNKFRFHSLWLFFQFMVIGGVIYHEELVDFTGDLILDYTQKSDLMVSRGISATDPACFMDKALGDSLEAMDGEHLFGGLEVGMSPFEAIWHISKMGGLDHFHIGEVEFVLTARSYFRNDLYGIMMYFKDYHDYAHADSLVCFLKQKYGPPHLFKSDESCYQAEWHFKYKHIVIESEGNVFGNGTLYIYQPQMLSEKIAIENQKKKEKADKLLEEELEREEQQRREELKQMEEMRKQKEKNRRLQNSL